jgi:hypothetical protein
VRRRASWFFLSSALWACASEPDFPRPPVPPPPQAAQSARAAEPGRLYTPLFSLTVSDPFAVPLYLEAVRRPATPLGPVDPGSVTALAVVDTQRVEARAAEQPLVLSQATLGEGERARLDLETAGHECFTAIAHGGLGVMELDVFISSGEATEPTILARDDKSGPVAVAGGASACPTPRPGCGPVCVPSSAVPAGLRVDVVVRKGRGPVVLGVARRAAQ